MNIINWIIFNIDFIINWIISNISLMTLIVTLFLATGSIITAIASLKSSKLNSEALRLASQPTLKVEGNEIFITPDIKLDNHDNPIIDESERYSINVNISISNISDNPAQNIIIDGIAKFKKSKPLNYDSLPIHLPEKKDFLLKDKDSFNCQIRFDNFIAKEIINDFIKGRKSHQGFAYLLEIDDKNKDLWPSTLLLIKILYYDTQGHEFEANKPLFFHIWKDSETDKLQIYLLNMDTGGFTEIKRVKKGYIKNYLNKYRHRRYSAFDGKKYDKNEVLLLVAKENKPN